MEADTFDDRAREMALRKGYSYPPKEEELRIEQIYFFDETNGLFLKTPLGTSQKSRMFIEVILGENMKTTGQVSIECKEYRDQTIAFFGRELCAEEGLHQHPFIRGLLKGSRAVVYLKPGLPR
jgi:hypothetical protein